MIAVRPAATSFPRDGVWLGNAAEATLVVDSSEQVSIAVLAVCSNGGQKMRNSDEVIEAWSRLARYFIGHVSETLAQAHGKGGTTGHAGFERLIRHNPPIADLWRAIAGLLLQTVKDETELESDAAPEQRDTWERVLAVGARIARSPLCHGEDGIRGCCEPHVCHPDTDSPLSYLGSALRRLGRRPRGNALWTGEGLDPLSGTGKSSLVRQIAALVKRPVRRVSLNGETSVADFVGHWTVNENKQTVFVKGILPQAMQEGFILQLDEVDAVQPEIGFVLQQVLEPGGRLLLTDTGEDIAPHSDFRLVATANTLGFGSDSALYSSGTHTLNFSWLDRWDVVVHLDYLPSKQEVDLLKSRHASLGKDLLKRLVKAATDLRKSHAAEELTSVITTRRLLALCARLERGNEMPRALAVCVLNKVPQEDTTVVRETFDHHLGPLAKGEQKSAK